MKLIFRNLNPDSYPSDLQTFIRLIRVIFSLKTLFTYFDDVPNLPLARPKFTWSTSVTN